MALSNAGFFRASMNTICRGGVVSCRPGYDFKFNIPDGNIQGAHFFQPFDDTPWLAVAVSGQVYVSQYPYDAPTLLENLQFREDSERIYFESGEKASQTNADGTVTLVTPYKILVIQDGFSPPGMWDGVTNRHQLDPLGIPIGTAMKWSGKRLWVARNRELFVGDIFDPTSFREGTYLSNAKSFLTERPIVALAEITSSSDPVLLAFTDTFTEAFQSSILQRSTWVSTVKFQSRVLPSIGCAAPLSIVTLNGVLWWWSQFGLTNFNAAMNANVNSQLSYQDAEMAVSKSQIGDGADKIAGTFHENFLLMSVPASDRYNSHTWVLDQAPTETRNVTSNGLSGYPAWASWWTGTRPVVWASGPVAGINRCFQFSHDIDGHNRCWEAFSQQRLDSGCPITWTLETRAYNNSNLSRKEFRWAQIILGELEGVVDMAVFYTGVSKGAYKRCLTKRMSASIGTIIPGRIYDGTTSKMYGLKKQTRVVSTIDIKNAPPEVTSCQVESKIAEREDFGFSLFMIFSGPGAVKGIRVFTSPVNEEQSGKCEQQELVDNHFVRFDGQASNDLAELDAVPVEEFFASSQGSETINGEFVSTSGEFTSLISALDAGKVAECHSQMQLDLWFNLLSPKLVGVPE